MTAMPAQQSTLASRRRRRRYAPLLALMLLALLAGILYGISSCAGDSEPDSTTGSGSAQGQIVDRPLTLSGTVETALTPSATEPVTLRLTNQNDIPMTITGLTVAVRDVSAMDGSDIDCDLSQFTIRQFSGDYGFSLAADRTRSLGELGFDPAQWPQITMVNAATNQDGCKNALIKLDLSGTALEVAS